ncbi:MAG: hypothetical protein A3D31_11360 [Candidatus Fluviicola riflensis]|nr:MAG: hypothetical protein CHH17_15785 [Candidatus Fluviicola riflensis]OGS77587.1 MAG: hypothetical protein A3D31_11360 [Candidatus Fluviicola riflensis]OGS84169.1 MAG: hypothetical protein A3E30_12765 [Fluviicola sp. RIFCSPHIGHO2_12_FULL_43_24]OGS84653.1 MAG: hypothetical protein A2724_08295 [Fluviicola sp. RIFCSPHIGHO2_01_FULL_43_53]
MKKVSTTILAFILLLSANSFGQDVLKNFKEKTEQFGKTAKTEWIPIMALTFIGIFSLITVYLYFIKKNKEITVYSLVVIFLLIILYMLN